MIDTEAKHDGCFNCHERTQPILVSMVKKVRTKETPTKKSMLTTMCVAVCSNCLPLDEVLES